MKEEKDERTPIKDGDARPDREHVSKTKKAGSPVGGKQRKFTKERGADTDSLEDYKDAK